MPRHEKRRTPTKWVSAALNAAVPDVSAVATSDTVSLAGALTTAAVNRQDPTVVSVRGQVSCSRLIASSGNVAIAWAIVLMRLELGAQTPVQTFSPFSTVDLEERDILAMGHIPAPPSMFLPSDSSLQTNKEAKVVDIHVKVSRKIKTNQDGLFFWFSSTDSLPPGVDNAFHLIGSFRTLLAWPS